MDDKEVQKRLMELGADVPLSTLRRWASRNERLIPRPIPYYKPLRRGRGRPPKNEGKEPQAQRGRFSYWTEESLEAAAAVWAIRYQVCPDESTQRNVSCLSVRQAPQKGISKANIVKGLQIARNLHILLYTDCKKAALQFRECLYPSGFRSDEIGQRKILNFGENKLYSLIPICIYAIEKVQHHIALNTPISLMYDWTINWNGEVTLDLLQMEKTTGLNSEIILRVTHVRPEEDGYSMGYGFPRTKEYLRGGFVDEFWLKGNQLGERFEPFLWLPHGYYDDGERADYLDRDSHGWADKTTEEDLEDDD